MNRTQMGLTAWLGVIIVLGLIFTHTRGFNDSLASTATSFGSVIDSLRNPPAPSAH